MRCDAVSRHARRSSFRPYKVCAASKSSSTFAPFGSKQNNCHVPAPACWRRSYLIPRASKRAFTARRSVALKAMWSLVADVAVRSAVSRATAYRYFPSRSALVTAVIDNSLGPVRMLASDNPDGRERVHELFVQTFPRLKEFEPQLRAADEMKCRWLRCQRATT